jgi:VIT1/CCC1 family predicted Fe2+/Mn2+ transporter
MNRSGIGDGRMDLEHSHEPASIAARLALGARSSHLRDWVYGAIDGGITTFAVVAGVVGAALDTRIVLILGAANLLADGVSMAAANYVGTRTELEQIARVRAMEERHVDAFPEGEREEIRQIYQAKGLSGEALERLVEVVTSRRGLWIDTMLAEEFGLASAEKSPLTAALSTFAGFLLAGLVPLLPFALGVAHPAETAALLTAVVFFAIGSIKSRWTTRGWLASGAETTAIGGAAAICAFAVGKLLERLV